MLRYRCHMGHVFTADAVLFTQGEEIEKLLGTLQRSHQERAAPARRMADRERARNYEKDASLVRELLRSGFAGTAADTNDG